MINQKWYYTGDPCNHGHVDKRSTKNRVCFECQRNRTKSFLENNNNYHHEYNKNYYPDNKQRTKELSEDYYAQMKQDNPSVLLDRQRTNSRNYIKNNKNLHANRGKVWCKENPGKKNAMTAKRRAKKLNATPLWVNHPKMQEVYLDCEAINTINKMCGGKGKFVVDHIIPLQGNNVSGLHIDSNLQIITERENAIKSNKFNEEEV